MSFEIDHQVDPQNKQELYPHIIHSPSLNTSSNEEVIGIATSPEGTLLIDDESVSFSIGREIFIESSESIGTHTLHRNRRGHVVSVDLGQPPLRFRPLDLGIPRHRVEEMTRGLKLGGIQYIILHGDIEPTSQDLTSVSEPFPIINEQQTLP